MTTATLPPGWQTWSEPEKKKLRDELEQATVSLRWKLWTKQARPEQLPPDGPWRTIYWRGGRGSGKTRSSSEAFAELIRQYPAVEDEPNEWGVVAPTFGDARDICIEGPSGLIAALGGRCAGGKLVRKGPLIATWNRSMGQLYLRDGTVIYADGADDGALRVQGKNMRAVWADEIGLWKSWKTAWDESIKYAVRIAPAKRIVSGTPKRDRDAIVLVRRLLLDPKVINRRLRTEDNAANLEPEAFEEFMEAKGTALGAQELDGDVLEEAEGALWTRDASKADAEQRGLILTERATLTDDAGALIFTDGRRVVLKRRVVALDPAEGEGDEQGCVAAAAGADGRYYVLYSRGDHLAPMGWLKACVGLYDRLKADRLIYERNGAMFLKPLLEQEFPHLALRKEDATQGKRTRAEPVSALYGSRRLVTHVILPDNDLVELEAEMTSFTGDPNEDSPGQLDALVWALHNLRGLSRPAKSTSVSDMQLPSGGLRR